MANIMFIDEQARVWNRIKDTAGAEEKGGRWTCARDLTKTCFSHVDWQHLASLG